MSARLNVRCDQCGDPLQPHACSPKWCSRTRAWSDQDRRKCRVTDEPFVREVLARFPGAEIVAVREETATDV